MSRNERISVIHQIKRIFFCFNHSFAFEWFMMLYQKYFIPLSFFLNNEGIGLWTEKEFYQNFLHLCDEKSVYSFISLFNSIIASFSFRFSFPSFDSEADLSIVYFVFFSSCVCPKVSLFCSIVLYLLYLYNTFSFVTPDAYFIYFKKRTYRVMTSFAAWTIHCCFDAQQFDSRILFVYYKHST